MDTENSKKSKPFKFVFHFSQRLDLRRLNKLVALQNFCLLHVEKYKTTAQKQ